MGINVTIKDLSSETAEILKSEARLNHRSLNAEIKFRLDKSIQKPKRDVSKILASIDKLRASTPPLNISDEELTAWKNDGRE